MSDRSSSNWALGFTAFAAWMMILIGTFHAIDGLAAIFKDEFFVPGDRATCSSSTRPRGDGST